jgi:hypothetical protein
MRKSLPATLNNTVTLKVFFAYPVTLSGFAVHTGWGGNGTSINEVADNLCVTDNQAGQHLPCLPIGADETYLFPAPRNSNSFDLAFHTKSGNVVTCAACNS